MVFFCEINHLRWLFLNSRSIRTILQEDRDYRAAISTVQLANGEGPDNGHLICPCMSCFFSTVWNPLETQWIDRIRWWHCSSRFQLLVAAAGASKSCLWMKGLNQGNCVTRTVDDEADIVCWALFFPNILQLYATRQCFAKYLAQFQFLSPFVRLT